MLARDAERLIRNLLDAHYLTEDDHYFIKFIPKSNHTELQLYLSLNYESFTHFPEAKNRAFEAIKAVRLLCNDIYLHKGFIVYFHPFEEADPE